MYNFVNRDDCFSPPRIPDIESSGSWCCANQLTKHSNLRLFQKYCKFAVKME